MQDGWDAVAPGARVVRLDRGFRWPGGRHLAVVLNVAYEGWSDGKAPGIGPMGNPLPAGAFDTKLRRDSRHRAIAARARPGEAKRKRDGERRLW